MESPRGVESSFKDVYEGEFVDGKRHGKGEIKYVNGDIYDGTSTNDKKWTATVNASKSKKWSRLILSNKEVEDFFKQTVSSENPSDTHVEQTSLCSQINEVGYRHSQRNGLN